MNQKNCLKKSSTLRYSDQYDCFADKNDNCKGHGHARIVLSYNIKDIWSMLLSYEKHPTWNTNIKHVEIYRRLSHSNHVEEVCVKFKFAIGPFFDTTLNMVHIVNKKLNRIEWHIDKSLPSHWLIKENQGSWELTPIDVNITLCTYNATVTTYFPVLYPIRIWVVRNGIQRATQWIKVALSNHTPVKKSQWLCCFPTS